jgi:hypothetical protein
VAITRSLLSIAPSFSKSLQKHVVQLQGLTKEDSFLIRYKSKNRSR